MTRYGAACRIAVAWTGAVLAGLCGVAAAQPAGPVTRVLVVSGAAGSDEYAERQQAWREAFVTHATSRLGIPPDLVTVLAERDGTGYPVATADEVRAALARLREAQGDADTLLILLLGHGTYDGVAAKFNLVGPDLEA